MREQAQWPQAEALLHEIQVAPAAVAVGHYLAGVIAVESGLQDQAQGRPDIALSGLALALDTLRASKGGAPYTPVALLRHA